MDIRVFYHRVLDAHPTTFTLSLDQNIIPTVDFLMHEVCLKNVEKEIEQNPSILGVSIDFNLKPTVAFLEASGYDLQQDLRGRHLTASLTGRIMPRL